MIIFRTLTAVCIASILPFAQGNVSNVVDVVDDHFSIIDQPFKETLTLDASLDLSGWTIGMDLSNNADVISAVSLLVPAYNNVMSTKNDTYLRRMVSVSIWNATLVATNRRHLRDSYASDMQAIHQQSVRVEVLGKSNGICRHCMGINLELSISGRRRKLSGFNALTPTFDKIVDEQNVLIAASNNPSIDHVNELWARVAILASQAQTASMNADTHENYLMGLQVELDASTAEIQAKIDRFNMLSGNGNRKLVGCPLCKLYKQIRSLMTQRDILKVRIDDAETKLTQLRANAQQLKSQVDTATLNALKYEKRVAKLAKDMAIIANAEIASNVQFV